MPEDDPSTAAPSLSISICQGLVQRRQHHHATDDEHPTPTPFEISAHDQTGLQVGSLKVVVPVATETECRSCHVTSGIGSTQGGITWANDADTEVQSKKNILRLHDAEQPPVAAGPVRRLPTPRRST
jgi:hypothetical protein